MFVEDTTSGSSLQHMGKSIVLFLCTGNYYRSRYAEELFNHFASKHSIKLKATSAGLRVPESSVFNNGPISQNTLNALVRNNIQPTAGERMPQQVASRDFDEAATTIALCEREHRPMLEEQFPDRIRDIVFWQVEDIDVEDPESATPQIFELVESLVMSLSEQRGAVTS